MGISACRQSKAQRTNGGPSNVGIKEGRVTAHVANEVARACPDARVTVWNQREEAFADASPADIRKAKPIIAVLS